MSVQLLGPLDAYLAPVVESVLAVLVVVNLATRHLAHRRNVRQADEEPEAISRFLPHEAANVLLLLVGLYFLTLEPHAGMVLSTLVLGMIVADVFEFESRKVEARRGLDLDRPKAAIGASVLVVLYVGFLTLFAYVEPFWDAIV